MPTDPPSSEGERGAHNCPLCGTVTYQDTSLLEQIAGELTAALRAVAKRADAGHGVGDELRAIAERFRTCGCCDGLGYANGEYPCPVCHGYGSVPPESDQLGSEGLICTCEPNFGYSLGSDCPVHGSDTDPSPDPVLSKVAAERDHYKERLAELEEKVMGLDSGAAFRAADRIEELEVENDHYKQRVEELERGVQENLEMAGRYRDRAEAAEERLEDLEERLRNAALDAGHYVEQLARVREWAEAVLGNDGEKEMWYLAQQVLFLLDQTDE